MAQRCPETMTEVESQQTKARFFHLCRLAILFLAVVLVACGETTTPTPTTLSDEPGASPPSPTVDDRFAEERERMVRQQIEARGIRDEEVLAAMRRVPRHRFVPERFVDQAYADHPLPIGHGQTISQPYIVAMMTEALQVEPGDRILEIGTGSGYQAAVLAEVGAEVYTIEIIPELAEQAEQQLHAAGYHDVQVRHADGYFGWEEHAPFDGIMVTAAPDHLPQPLANQLEPGGHLVIPIGPPGSYQTLWLFTKQEDGELDANSLGAVRFVPFTREQ